MVTHATPTQTARERRTNGGWETNGMIVPFIKKICSLWKCFFFWKQPTVKILRILKQMAETHFTTVLLSDLNEFYSKREKNPKRKECHAVGFYCYGCIRCRLTGLVLLLWMCKHLHFYIWKQQQCLWQQPLQRWLKLYSGKKESMRLVTCDTRWKLRNFNLMKCGEWRS